MPRYSLLWYLENITTTLYKVNTRAWLMHREWKVGTSITWPILNVGLRYNFSDKILDSVHKSPLL
jgi:hypothetical protein